MPLRRLRVLIDHLPSTSPLSVSIHGEAAEWTLGDDLLAAIWFTLQQANHQRGGLKGPKPKPFQRPKSKARERLLLERLHGVAKRAAAARERRRRNRQEVSDTWPKSSPSRTSRSFRR